MSNRRLLRNIAVTASLAVATTLGSAVVFVAAFRADAKKDYVDFAALYSLNGAGGGDSYRRRRSRKALKGAFPER